MQKLNEAVYLHELTEDQLFAQMIEVTLRSPETFLVVKETLTRMGVSNLSTMSLYQTCHIFHRRGRYYISHFKELIRLDGKEVSMTQEDFLRRNAIALKLEEWGLVKSLKPISPIPTVKLFDIIPWADRKNWKLVPKHHIGTRKKNVARS